MGGKRLKFAAWLVLVFGAISIISGWNLISNPSNSDDGEKGIVVVLVGIPAFLAITSNALFLSFVSKRRPVPLCIGAGWLIVGAGLHALARIG